MREVHNGEQEERGMCTTGKREGGMCTTGAGGEGCAQREAGGERDVHTVRERCAQR